jgi:type II secretory ATPase GspE/PulE/Tfp pilus assembly ATPase PilB-like protein
MTPDILEMIMQGVSADQLTRKARSNGMNTLRESAIKKALAGDTSVEEVFRVTTEDAISKTKGQL